MQLKVIQLRLNDNLMPAPAVNGVSFKRNPVWSKNAGRNGRTIMIGTILASKLEVTIKWPPLTEEQYQLIDSNLSDAGNPWIHLEMTMEDDSVMEFDAYSGPIGSTGWTALGGQWRRTDVSVTVIER